MTSRAVLLRPDQAAAAVAMGQAGASADEVAERLAVPVEVVARSLRLSEPAPVVAAVLGPVAIDDLDVHLRRAFGSPRRADDGLDPMPSGPMVLGPVVVVGPLLSVRRLPRPGGWRAPVFVEDDVAWPPAPAADDRWRVVPVREGSVMRRTALREVALWGARVLVDDDRRVFCPVCRRLVDVVDLGRNLYRGVDEISGGGVPSHALGLPAEPRAQVAG